MRTIGVLTLAAVLIVSAFGVWVADKSQARGGASRSERIHRDYIIQNYSGLPGDDAVNLSVVFE